MSRLSARAIAAGGGVDEEDGDFHVALPTPTPSPTPISFVRCYGPFLRDDDDDDDDDDEDEGEKKRVDATQRNNDVSLRLKKKTLAFSGLSKGTDVPCTKLKPIGGGNKSKRTKQPTARTQTKPNQTPTTATEAVGGRGGTGSGGVVVVVRWLSGQLGGWVVEVVAKGLAGRGAAGSKGRRKTCSKLSSRGVETVCWLWCGVVVDGGGL